MKKFKQNGQVLILTGLFLVAIMAAYFGVFKAGWITTEKSRLQSNADAAAYSAALLQARDMNFQAYMNRAMIANQASIGQAVAMSSYMQVNQQMWYWFENIGDLATVIPGVGPWIEKATELGQGIFGIINKNLQKSLSFLTLNINLAIFAQSTASKAWHAATVASTPVFIYELIKFNDPDVTMPAISQAGFVLDLKNNYNYFTRADISKAGFQSISGKDRQPADQFRQLILKSRDDFTKARSKVFWRFDIGIGEIKMRQKGGTEFGTEPGKRLPYYSWSAVDTVSYHVTCRGLGCRWKERVPVSWGRQATWHDRTFRWSEDEKLWDNNIEINEKAWKMVKRRDYAKEGFMEGRGTSARKIGHYKVQDPVINDGFGKMFKNIKPGMKDFYYLRTDNKFKPCGKRKSDKSSSQGCPIKVVLTKPVKLFEALANSNTVAKEDINLLSIAAGAAVFEPKLKDKFMFQSKVELANLYHPFWQARLIELPSENDRHLVNLMAKGL